MTAPNTDKAVYINGTQVGFDVGAALTDYDPAVTRTLIAMDWGAPERERFYRARPLRDGSYRRGARTGRRTISLQLLSLLLDVVPDNDVERYRDFEWASLLDLVYPERGLSTIKVTGQSSEYGSYSRIIRGELANYPSWIWSPDSVGAGYVGGHVGRVAVMPFVFECPFPWFEDETASATSALTLDGTLRTTSVTNNGLVSCGVQITIAGTGTGLTIAMSNATSGASSLIGSGFTLTDVAPTSGNIVIDWYYSDPTAWSVLQGSTDLRSKLNTTANHGLIRGGNTLSHQVTVGSPTGCTITYRYKQLWGNP